MEEIRTLFALTFLIVGTCGLIYIGKNLIKLMWHMSYITYYLEQADDEKE